MSTGDLHITRDHDKGTETVEREIAHWKNASVLVDGKWCEIKAAPIKELVSVQPMPPEESK